MKFLLVAINAKYIHSNLAVYCLSAYAKKQNVDMEIAQYTINNQMDRIVADIYKQKPDFIGFSCYIWNINYVEQIAKDVKKVLPNCVIWLGGPEVSYELLDKMKKYPFAEGIMVGEGEITCSEVAKVYMKENDKIKRFELLSNIDGVALRDINDSEKVIVTKTRDYMNMDDIPFVYGNIDEFKNRIIYYETSRGCPYDCAYCMSSIDKRVRFRSFDLVKEELKFFLDNKISQVKFVDRTFNCKRSHTKNIWQYILENDNGVTNFHFEVSADLLNDDELELIAKMRPRLIQLEIGVQSTNEKTLEAIHRKTNFAELCDIVNKIKKLANTHQHLDLIAGLPYEDYNSFHKSFDDVYALRPEQLQLGFLKVLSGANMKIKANEYGIVYGDSAPYEVLYTDWLSFSDVLKLKGIEEMVEAYYNSGQFNNIIKYFENFFDSPFSMYEYMADYYEKHEIMDIGHARISRYNILLDICEQIGANTDTVIQIMMHDLYLRENLKKRPDFAYDMSKYKDLIRDIYVNDERIVNLKGYEEYNQKQIMRITHAEHYSIDIEKTIESGKRCEADMIIVYDYMNRNPVNYEANTIIVKDIVISEKNGD